MTDKEIIKAFEWCIGGTSDKCRNCPLENERPEAFCVDKLEELVLEKLNRQQAEIEDLKKIKENSLEIISIGEKQILEIREKSIKEFAERLKNVTLPIRIGGQYNYDVISKQGIDHILKEMVGDAE